MRSNNMKRKIEIRYEKKDFEKKAEEKLVTKFAKKVLKEIVFNSSFCSIFFASSKTIKELNWKYLKKNYATDVLSFSQIEGEKADFIKSNFLGDIIISIPYAEEEAKKNSHELITEIYLLILHGLLHLIGYDHEKEEKKNKNKMLKLQYKIFKKLTGIDISI
jgi:probable rRNA maturation factor